MEINIENGLIRILLLFSSIIGGILIHIVIQKISKFIIQLKKPKREFSISEEKILEAIAPRCDNVRSIDDVVATLIENNISISPNFHVGYYSEENDKNCIINIQDDILSN